MLKETIPDWYSFLVPELSKRKENIKMRDRVVAICSSCNKTEVASVVTLINQIQRIKTRRCASCAGKLSGFKKKLIYK